MGFLGFFATKSISLPGYHDDVTCYILLKLSCRCHSLLVCFQLLCLRMLELQLPCVDVEPAKSRVQLVRDIIFILRVGEGGFYSDLKVFEAGNKS